MVRPIVRAGRFELAYPGRSAGVSRRRWRAPAALAVRAAMGACSPEGTGTSTPPSSSSITVRVWWLTGRWRSRGSALERRGESRVGKPRAREAWAVSRAAMPPWPRAVSEPMMPGPGPAMTASHPSFWAAASRAPATEIASCSPAVGGGRGDVPAEQAAPAQLGDVAAERAGQRPSPGLHVADLDPRRRLRGRPGCGREVAMQRQNQDGYRPPRPFRCAFPPYIGDKAHRKL